MKIPRTRLEIVRDPARRDWAILRPVRAYKGSRWARRANRGGNPAAHHKPGYIRAQRIGVRK